MTLETKIKNILKSIALAGTLLLPAKGNALQYNTSVPGERFYDKSSIGHVLLGFALSSYLYMDVRHNWDGLNPFGNWRYAPYPGVTPEKAKLYAVGLTLSVGLAKEIWDGFMVERGDGFSINDFYWDCVGTAIGTLLAQYISNKLEDAYWKSREVKVPKEGWEK